MTAPLVLPTRATPVPAARNQTLNAIRDVVNPTLEGNCD